MTNVTATCVIDFCSGHRVLGHQGKCRYMHGHNYRAVLTARRAGQALNALGMVVDFAVLKSSMKAWIDEHFDHGFIVHSADDEALAALRSMCEAKYYTLEGCNPTAENLAAVLLTTANSLMRDHDIEVVKVRLWETPTCYAEVHP